MKVTTMRLMMRRMMRHKIRQSNDWDTHKSTNNLLKTTTWLIVGYCYTIAYQVDRAQTPCWLNLLERRLHATAAIIGWYHQQTANVAHYRIRYRNYHWRSTHSNNRHTSLSLSLSLSLSCWMQYHVESKRRTHLAHKLRTPLGPLFDRIGPHFRTSKIEVCDDCNNHMCYFLFTCEITCIERRIAHLWL